LGCLKKLPKWVGKARGLLVDFRSGGETLKAVPWLCGATALPGVKEQWMSPLGPTDYEDSGEGSKSEQRGRNGGGERIGQEGRLWGWRRDGRGGR